MTEFQKKRLAYFIKAARNYDWIRLGPGDVEILGEAEVNQHNYKAADSWENAAMMQMEGRSRAEDEVIDLKEEIVNLKELLNNIYAAGYEDGYAGVLPLQKKTEEEENQIFGKKG